MEYGRDFQIFFPDNEDSKVPLDEGKNEVTSTNCNLTAKHHFALESMNVRQYVEGKFRKCIKVNRTSKDVDLEKAMYCYMFKLRFFNGVAEPLESLVHITSEKNAYGAVYEMWYNGEVEQYVLKKQARHYVNVLINERRNHRHQCQDQSYYECLVSKFRDDKSCKGQRCAPFTLPELNNLEYCDLNTKEGECNDAVLSSIFDDYSVCRGDRVSSCVVKDYKVKDNFLPVPESEDNGYSIQVFMYPVKSSHSTLRKAYKTIFTEYYLLDGYALTGTIGGTLGLMIGFSFMGFITSVTEFVIGIKALQQKSKKIGKAKKSKDKRKSTKEEIGSAK